MAQSKASDPRPRRWEQGISCAYHRLIGFTIAESAKRAGVGKRTLDRWLKADWWPDACAEASSRWLGHVEERSRAQLVKGVEAGDTSIALKIIERLVPELAPPSVSTIHHAGPDGGPVRITEITLEYPNPKEGEDE